MKLLQKSRSAFTLVEVVLAVGIVAFAFVTTMSLLPVGLNISRQAMDTTVVSQIQQRLSSQALQTDFSKLTGLGEEAHYFDQEGKPVAPAASIYKVAVRVNKSTQLPNSQSTASLATVSIYVLPTRGKSPESIDPTTDPQAQKFNLLISNNGI